MSRKTSLVFVLIISSIIFNYAVNAEWIFNPVGNPSTTTFASDSSEQKLFMSIDYSGYWISRDGGTSWEGINNEMFETNQIIGNDFSILDADADTVIIRAYNYHGETWIFLTFDGGQSWQQLDVSFLPTHHCQPSGKDFLLIDKSNPNEWFYVNDLYFASSEDGGNSWTSTLLDSTYDMAFGWTKSGLYRDPDNPEHFYVPGIFFPYEDHYHGGLMRSMDNGESWEAILPLNDLFGMERAGVNTVKHLSNGDLFVTIRRDEGGDSISVVRSSDNGQTWEVTGAGLPSLFSCEHLIEVQGNPGLLYATNPSGYYGMFVSEDYGNNWQRVAWGPFSSAYSLKHIYQNPWSGTIYFSVPGHGVLASDDYGETFRSIPMPDSIGSISRRRIPAIAPDAVYFTDEIEKRWVWRPEDNVFVFHDILLCPQDTVFVENQRIVINDSLQSRTIRCFPYPFIELFNKIEVSLDNGTSWTMHDAPYLHYTHYTQPGELYPVIIGIGVDSIFATEDLGESWTGNPLPANECHFISTWNDTSVFFLSTTQELYRTNDRGETWQNLEFPGENPIMPIWVDDYLVVLAEGATWLLDGEMWVDNRGTPFDYNMRVINIPRDEDPDLLVVYYLFDNMIYISDDYGGRWDEMIYQMPYPDQMRGIQSMVYDPYRHRLWAVTSIGLAYNDFMNDVPENPIVFLPAQQHLLGVYPNPFNHTAKIRYQLPVDGEIRLEVIDILGKTVATIADGYFLKGDHQVSWTTNGLSSGTYFVVLNHGNDQTIQKVILAK